MLISGELGPEKLADWKWNAGTHGPGVAMVGGIVLIVGKFFGNGRFRPV